MTTLQTILTADTAIPAAFETKFPMLPKLSKQLVKIAAKVPVGPNLPGIVATVTEPPAPTKSGQPLANFFNGTPITGPNLGSAAPAAAVAPVSSPLSPRNPGTERGGVNFVQMPLSPNNPGVNRGSVGYSDTFGL